MDRQKLPLSLRLRASAVNQIPRTMRAAPKLTTSRTDRLCHCSRASHILIVVRPLCMVGRSVT